MNKDTLAHSEKKGQIAKKNIKKNKKKIKKKKNNNNNLKKLMKWMNFQDFIDTENEKII